MPEGVVQRWADALAGGDVDEATSMVAPAAALHVDGDVVVGREEIGRYWEASGLVGGPSPDAVVDVPGTGEVRVSWASGADRDEPLECRMRVERDEIVEQRVGVAETRPAGDETPTIEITTSGGVTRDDRSYAVDKVMKVVDVVGDPVLHVNLRLDGSANADPDSEAEARVSVDLNGEIVRAQVAAGTVREAADLLEERVRARVEHLAEHRQALKQRGPTSPPGEWRHGDMPTQRPEYYPRPVEERRVVRHKSFAPTVVTVDEAVFDLESLDYDFYLFTDVASRDDALVSRRPGGDYVLRCLGGADPDSGARYAAAVDIDPTPAPEMTLDDAREALDAGGEPWVFFRDRETGRGRVVYRRYDGHYGLITPREVSAAGAGDGGSS